MTAFIGQRALAAVGAVALVAALGIGNNAWADRDEKEKDGGNIVVGVISAPVVTNGLVAGEPTEINVILNAPKVAEAFALDPQEFGHQIPAGGRMEIELSDTFTRNTRINPDTGEEEVVPINPNANVILTTGPQNPIIAQSGASVARGNWSVSDDGANVITITPNGGSGKNGLEGERAKEIGVKVAHIRPNPRNPSGAPYQNGDAGEVGTIYMRIFDKNGKLKEAGFGDAVFQASVGRQIHNTNAGLRTRPGGSPDAELIENVNFQRVGPGTKLTNMQKTVPFSAGLPYAPRFLLFEALEVSGDSFIPQDGIANVSYAVDADRPWIATVLENGINVVGTIVMSGPSAGSRGEILPSPGPTVLDGNGSFLNVPVEVGSESGVYTVTVSLLGGGEARNTIVVKGETEDDDD